jgi:hypothetical protein
MIKHDVPPKIVEALNDVLTFIYGIGKDSEDSPDESVRKQVKLIERWLRRVGNEKYNHLKELEAQK